MTHLKIHYIEFATGRIGDTRAFFEKSPLVRRVSELRAADSLVISAASDILTVTDVWRVTQSSEGVATVQAEKVVFRCRTGEKIESTGMTPIVALPLLRSADT